MSPATTYFSFSTTVTLKIRSRSPKFNQFFVMSQLYIHANLITIKPLVHKILCREERVMTPLMPTQTPMPILTGSTQKTISPPHLRQGDINITDWVSLPRKSYGLNRRLSANYFSYRINMLTGHIKPLTLIGELCH